MRRMDVDFEKVLKPNLGTGCVGTGCPHHGLDLNPCHRPTPAAYRPRMPFSKFGLGDEILRAIQKAGYTRPTPVQAAAIPKVMQGNDLIAIAQTGTGKTAAFVLPMLHRLRHGPPPGPTARHQGAHPRSHPRARRPDHGKHPGLRARICRSASRPSSAESMRPRRSRPCRRASTSSSPRRGA